MTHFPSGPRLQSLLSVVLHSKQMFGLSAVALLAEYLFEDLLFDLRSLISEADTHCDVCCDASCEASEVDS